MKFLVTGLSATGHTIDTKRGISTRGQIDFLKLYPPAPFKAALEAIDADISRAPDFEIVLDLMPLIAMAHVAHNIVHQPIYASMLGMLLPSVTWCGTLPGWPIALVLFLIGNEIRVRVEDNLLRERFGSEFTEWSRSVPAYLPFIR